MDVNFQNRECSCLNQAVREMQNSEQTQEIRLTEGMPDVGRILSAWGQPILRSKEWGADTLNYTGGMMVWVLYAPEDGSAERCIEGWIPFQLRWDVPEDLPEGQLRLRLLPRLVDARSVSPRKILVRAGMAVLAEAFVPAHISVPECADVPEGVELIVHRSADGHGLDAPAVPLGPAIGDAAGMPGGFQLPGGLRDDFSGAAHPGHHVDEEIFHALGSFLGSPSRERKRLTYFSVQISGV